MELGNGRKIDMFREGYRDENERKMEEGDKNGRNFREVDKYEEN